MSTAALQDPVARAGGPCPGRLRAQGLRARRERVGDERAFAGCRALGRAAVDALRPRVAGRPVAPTIGISTDPDDPGALGAALGGAERHDVPRRRGNALVEMGAAPP